MLVLQAMCKIFAMYCQEHGIELQSKSFSLEYDTTIPRQAGLSGSSAIACAALNCLLQYHDIEDRYALCYPVTLLHFGVPKFPRCQVV